MIIMGAGICQWFHGDATYRAILSLLILTGCMGRNGGRAGRTTSARRSAVRSPAGSPSPQRPRLGAAAAYDDRHVVLVHAHRPVAQRRLLGRLAELASGQRTSGGQAHRRHHRPVGPGGGWMPFCPAVREQSAAGGGGRPGRGRRRHRGQPGGIRGRCSARRVTLTSAIEDVDAPENWPRTLVLWRSNRMGSSAKGNEYFLRNLLGTHHNVLGGEERARLQGRPR